MSEDTVVVGHSTREIMRARRGKTAPTTKKAPASAGGLRERSKSVSDMKAKQAELKRAGIFGRRTLGKPQQEGYSTREKAPQVRQFVQQKNQQLQKMGVNPNIKLRSGYSTNLLSQPVRAASQGHGASQTAVRAAAHEAAKRDEMKRLLRSTPKPRSEQKGTFG